VTVRFVRARGRFPPPAPERFFAIAPPLSSESWRIGLADIAAAGRAVTRALSDSATRNAFIATKPA